METPWNELRKDFQDEEYRYAYAESFLNSSIATQILVLREQHNLTQEKLAKNIGTKQAGISRLENINYSSWSIKTLKKLARAFGCRLRVSFETFGLLLEEDELFSPESLKRPKFEDDPVFKEASPEEKRQKDIKILREHQINIMQEHSIKNLQSINPFERISSGILGRSEILSEKGTKAKEQVPFFKAGGLQS